MTAPDGLSIIGHSPQATCIACSRPKECFLVRSTDGTFDGPICFADLKRFAKVRLAHRSRPDRGTPLFDGDGVDRESVRA
jgi:hypothetical protein